MSGIPERIVFHAELLSLRFHLLHDLPVVLLQPVPFDDFLQAFGITSARGIARPLDFLRPALVVIGRQRETAGIAAVLFQEAGVMFIRIPCVVVTTEFLVGLIVGVQTVPTSLGNPFGRRLDTEMIVLFTGEFALPVAALQNALCQCHGGRNTVPPHLLHSIVRILFCILLILACHVSTSSCLDVVRSRSVRRLYRHGPLVLPLQPCRNPIHTLSGQRYASSFLHCHART